MFGEINCIEKWKRKFQEIPQIHLLWIEESLDTEYKL